MPPGSSPIRSNVAAASNWLPRQMSFVTAHRRGREKLNPEFASCEKYPTTATGINSGKRRIL